MGELLLKKKKGAGLLITMFLVTLLYVYFHSPIYNNSVFTFRYLFIFALLYVVLNANAFLQYLRLFRKELTFVIVLILICAIRAAFGGVTTVLVMWVRSIFEFFIIPFAIIQIMNKNIIGELYDIRRLLLIVGCVGTVITLACVTLPPVNLYVKSMWTVVEEDSYLATLTYRCFGISDNLTYSYGIIQGIILLIGLIYMKDYKWVIPFLPFMAISILLNARTGFVVTMMGYIIYLLLGKKKLGSIFKSVLLVALGAMIVVSFLNARIDEEGIAWILDLFTEFGNVSSGNVDETTLGALTGKMAVWPQNAEQWLIGRGYVMYHQDSGVNTDVGFFQQLNYGGILYILPLYCFVYYMFKQLKKYNQKPVDWIFVAIFVISNLKGNFIPYSGGFRLLFLYYSFLLFSYKSSTPKTLIRKSY